MAQHDRNPERGGRAMRSGPDRDPYRAGDERRYLPDRGDRERGFRGDRSYATGGYSEEQGYRRENRDDWDRDARDQRDQDYRHSQRDRDEQFGPNRDRWSQQNRNDAWQQGSGRDRSRAQDERYARQEDEYRRGQFTGQHTRGYGDYSDTSDLARGWSNLDTPAYFGTGNYAGSYGSGPGSRASEEGLFGPSSNAGSPDWNGPDADWIPESNLARGTDTDYSRDTSGDYSNYGRSQYGAQSSYGRNYGDETPWNRSGRSQQSWQESHRGRGPKGYARSDERLREVICERLTDDPRIDASEIHVEVNAQTVKLTGTVRDRRTKYEVEDLVEHCGAKEIDNQLRVQSRWGSQSSDANQESFRSTVQSGSATQSTGSRYDYSGSSTDAQSGSSQLASAAGRNQNVGSAATSTSSDGPTPSGTGASASAPGTSPGASKRDNRSS